MAKDVTTKKNDKGASAKEVTNFVEKAKTGSVGNEDIFKFAKLFKVGYQGSGEMNWFIPILSRGEETLGRSWLAQLADPLGVRLGLCPRATTVAPRQDDLTLDNMSRTQLVTMCTFMNIQPYGADAFIRFKLRSHIRDLQARRPAGLLDVTR